MPGPMRLTVAHLIDSQIEVISRLQDVHVRLDDAKKLANPTYDVKALAVSLGIAVDKLEVLSQLRDLDRRA